MVLFGFAEPAATDLQGGFADLARVARSMGGDAVINARFEHTQYTTLTRALFAVLFFIPLPAEVTVTGEVVRFEPPPAAGRCAMRALAACVAIVWLAGCGALVRGPALSGKPADTSDRSVYLSTGGPNRPFRTLGFVQIRGYGVNVAGIADVGQTALEGTIRGYLVEEARKLGGDGVVNIEFLDENPQTDFERVNAAAQTASSVAGGKPQVQTTERYVTVTGEVIQFVE